MFKEMTGVMCTKCGRTIDIETDAFHHRLKLMKPGQEWTYSEDFNPEKMYGEFIEIVPSGDFSIHRTRCFSGEWNDENITKVKEILTTEYTNIIPMEYMESVEIITKPPSDSPLEKHGTVGWKYSCIKTKFRLQRIKQGAQNA